MNILLAEDDHNIATISKMTLEHIGGHTVTWVDDGQKALDHALEGNYDLILLDEMMPQKNGLLVCREYKQLTTNPSPIIFLSAKSQTEDVAEFERNGLGYIAKPFDPSELCKMIDEIMTKQGAAA